MRHAEALANPDLRYLGSRDDPLTARGQWQALQLAQAFAPLELAAVYTSPLTRAVATALPMAEAHGLSIVPEPRLVEAAMGTWEGLRRAEILARSADDAALHHQWEADPTCTPPSARQGARTAAALCLTLSPCTVGLPSGLGAWEGISIHHLHLPRPRHPIRAGPLCRHSWLCRQGPAPG